MSYNYKLSVVPLQGTVGLSAVCDCGVSSLYLLTCKLEKEILMSRTNNVVCTRSLIRAFAERLNILGLLSC